MELLRRRQPVSTNSETANLLIQDDYSDTEDLQIDPEILKIYENLNSEPVQPLVRNIRRNGLSSKEIMAILFVCLCGFAWLANVLTYRQVQKLKAEKGHYNILVHPDMWWNSILVYYIYPKSFQDSNADGVGDIKGIIERVGHLEYLRVNAVILGSVMKAASLEDGHDILDFNDIDPLYGTLDDLKELIQVLHSKEIKLILEVTPNHTSKKHKWFQKSRQGGPNNKYRDYYIWHPGKQASNGSHVPPSNWLSIYGGSAWQWDEERGEYYLHQYGIDMPDLNHRNPNVRQEMMGMFQFWLDLGIDGVQMEGMHVLFEMEEFTLDEPEKDESNAKPHEYKYLDHVYTHDQPDIHEFMATWRELIDDYHLSKAKKILLSADVLDDQMMDVHKYYQTGIDVPVNYFLAQMEPDCDGWCMHSIVDAWMVGLDEGKTTFWMLSSTELGRLVAKKGERYAGALAMLHLLLPGTAIIYYGDEIGMTNTALTFHDTKDLRAIFVGHEAYHECSRDPWRTPMQWNNNSNGGFTTGDRPWLPLHPSYPTNNVLFQHDSNDYTPLKLYRELALLREKDAFKFGSLKAAVASKNIYSFMRYVRDAGVYLVCLNIGKEKETQDYTHTVGVDSGPLKVYYPSLFNGKPLRTFKQDQVIHLDKLELYPGEAMVIQLF